MDDNTVIHQLSTEVDNLMRIYQGLAAHVDSGTPGISQLRSQEIRRLGTAIQSLDQHIQILSRQICLDQTPNVRPESDKTYSVTYSDEGWRLAVSALRLVHQHLELAPPFAAKRIVLN
jgi:hypothetical protein